MLIRINPISTINQAYQTYIISHEQFSLTNRWNPLRACPVRCLRGDGVFRLSRPQNVVDREWKRQVLEKHWGC